MDTLFGRKKSRARQSSISGGQDLRSVPYDRVLPGPPVTVSGRQSAASSISAPTTNPTLTTNGTDLNVRTIQRSKAERDRAYAAASTPNTRSGSPNASLLTDDSSTHRSESTDSIPSPPPTSAVRKLRQSGSSSGRRSPSNHDSLQSLPPIPPTPFSPPGSAASTSGTIRPMSSSSARSDNRSSRYTFQSEPHSSHSHHHFPHFHRHGTMDDFNFPRPDNDSEIEALFENIVRTRDLGKLPPLTIDQKWHMVESDERIRWRDEKTKAKKVPEQSRPGGFEEGSPEWYLTKFLENSITPKGASGLLVSLRGHEVWCVISHSHLGRV